MVVVVVVLYPLTRAPRLWARYNSKFSTSSASFDKRGGFVVVAVVIDCWRSFRCEAAQTDEGGICFDDDRRSNCGPRRASERDVVEVRS